MVARRQGPYRLNRWVAERTNPAAASRRELLRIWALVVMVISLLLVFRAWTVLELTNG